jgi:hypothetical protein
MKSGKSIGSLNSNRSFKKSNRSQDIEVNLLFRISLSHKRFLNNEKEKLKKVNEIKEKLKGSFSKIQKRVSKLEEGGVYECIDYLLTELKRNHFSCKCSTPK